MNWVNVTEDQLTQRARDGVNGLVRALQDSYGYLESELMATLTEYETEFVIEVTYPRSESQKIGLAIPVVQAGNTFDMRSK